MSLSAKKSLGQNFLKAPHIITKMIEASSVEKNDTVIEIGPGKGALTKALLEKGVKVYAYELDVRMVEFLKEEYAHEIQEGQLKLIHKDILELTEDELKSFGSYKVIANIPYYISNPILKKFLTSTYQPMLMCLLVQKEVASRIAREQKESILSLSVKCYGTPRFLVKVQARYFSPQPKVDSAVLVITDISKQKLPTPEIEQRFFALIKAGFAHKRKKLCSNLTSGGHRNKGFWEDKLEKIGYPPTTRAEDLELHDWLALLEYSS